MKFAIALLVLSTFCNLRGIDGRVTVSAPPVGVLALPTARRDSIDDVASSTDSNGIVAAGIPNETAMIASAFQQAQGVERITEYVQTRTILREFSKLSKYSTENDSNQPHERSAREAPDSMDYYWPIIEYAVETVLAAPNKTEVHSLSDLPSYALAWLLNVPSYFVKGANEGMSMTLQAGMSVAWNLVRSMVIPWLDACLLRLADAGVFPENIAMTIREMHSMVQLLQALGYLR